MSRDDAVDALLRQWDRTRPGLDVSPMGVIGRLGRANTLLTKSVGEVFARHGLTIGEFDVLATLLRSGQPHRLSVGRLHRHAMVTAGAMTHRLDRLEVKGYVTRAVSPDSRRVVDVELTPEGEAIGLAALADHLDNEHRLLAGLSADEADRLAQLLRALLLSLGDEAPTTD